MTDVVPLVGWRMCREAPFRNSFSSAEYTEHLNRLRSDALASTEGHKAELGKIDHEMERLIDAIVVGVPAYRVKDRMTAIDARKTELEGLLGNAPELSAVLVHSRMGDRYRQEVGRLRETLNEQSRRKEAAEIIRALIDCIVLQPSGTGRSRTLTVDLIGHLAGILSLAAQKAKGAAGALASDQQTKLVAGTGLGLRLPKTDDLDRQTKLVAGARFGRDRHVLRRRSDRNFGPAIYLIFAPSDDRSPATIYHLFACL